MLASSAGAQERANAGDQRALELLAARRLVDVHSSLGQLVLDSRLYAHGILQFGTNGGISGIRPAIEPASEPASHRDSAHVAALVKVLGVAAVIDDPRSCITPHVDLCRAGSYPGIVSFSAAWVTGDTAEISASVMTEVRPGPDGRRRLRFVTNGQVIRFQRTDGGWRITETHSVHVQGS